MEGKGLVNITPALVPIHNKSLQIKSDVTRKQAALCCRMIASAPMKKKNNVFKILVKEQVTRYRKRWEKL